MTNKYRRHLNSLQRERQFFTDLTGAEKLKRKPLKGFEEYYEITSKGHVYSLRLKKFIKHKYFNFGDKGWTYIEFQINNEKYKLSIKEAIENTWGIHA